MATYESTVISKDLIFHNLQRQRNTGQFCDIRLVIGDRFTFIHSAVVCPVSLFLYNTFLEIKQRLRFKKSEKLSTPFTEINLQGINSEDCFPCLNKIMDLIYGSTTVVENDHFNHFQSYCSKLYIKNILLSNENIANDDVECQVKRLPTKSECLINEKSRLPKCSMSTLCSDKTPVISKESIYCDSVGNNLISGHELFYTNISINKTNRNDSLKLPINNDLKILEDTDAKEELIPQKNSFVIPKTVSCGNLLDLPITNGFETSQITEYKVNSLLTNNVIETENNLPKSLIRRKQVCLECKSEFFKNVDLLNHLIETRHGGTVCYFCDAEVSDSSQLEKHFNIHKHAKPYICICCNLRFKSRSLHETHFLSHTTQRLFTCTQCGKASKSKLALKYHLRVHSNEKKYLCDKCGFSTLYPGMIRAHKRLHEGNLLKCSYPNCTFTSIYKGHLKEHSLTHGNEHSFVCDTCGLKFTRKGTLRRHALKHNNGICCPHCRFKASREDILVSHIHRRHALEISHLDDIGDYIGVDIQPAADNLITSR